MTNTQFVTAMQQIYSEVRAVGGSIILDGENRTRSADEGPYGAIKLSVELAWDIMGRLDSGERRAFVERVEEIIRHARHCRETQENPLTKDLKNAKCRPIIEIDENGMGVCSWMK